MGRAVGGRRAGADSSNSLSGNSLSGGRPHGREASGLSVRARRGATSRRRGRTSERAAKRAQCRLISAPIRIGGASYCECEARGRRSNIYYVLQCDNNRATALYIVHMYTAVIVNMARAHARAGQVSIFMNASLALLSHLTTETN